MVAPKQGSWSQVMVRVRTLRTQQRVKNRCQLTSSRGAGKRVIRPGRRHPRTKILWLDNEQQRKLVVCAQPGNNPSMGNDFSAFG
jgi:hypothetical protein